MNTNLNLVVIFILTLPEMITSKRYDFQTSQEVDKEFVNQSLRSRQRNQKSLEDKTPKLISDTKLQHNTVSTGTCLQHVAQNKCGVWRTFYHRIHDMLYNKHCQESRITCCVYNGLSIECGSPGKMKFEERTHCMMIVGDHIKPFSYLNHPTRVYYVEREPQYSEKMGLSFGLWMSINGRLYSPSDETWANTGEGHNLFLHSGKFCGTSENYAQSLGCITVDNRCYSKIIDIISKGDETVNGHRFGARLMSIIDDKICNKIN